MERLAKTKATTGELEDETATLTARSNRWAVRAAGFMVDGKELQEELAAAAKRAG